MDEVANLRGAPQQSGWEAEVDRCLARRDYRSVVSIGSQCLTAVMLQCAGLKRFSGPFDWIFSNLRMVCDCIEDDFATFLDPRHIVAIPPHLRTVPDAQFAHHMAYFRRYRLATIFNHSDPTQPEVYAYLQRCVDRFRHVLASAEPQLLVAFSTRAQGGLHAFDRLCELLVDRPSVEACVFIIREPAEERRLGLWEEHGRHRLFDLHPESSLAGIRFEKDADNDFAVNLLQRIAALRA